MITATAMLVAAWSRWLCFAFALTIPDFRCDATGGEKSSSSTRLLSPAHTSGPDIVGAEKYLPMNILGLAIFA
jgi:hypothetical protein